MSYSKKNVINVSSLQSLLYVMKTNSSEKDIEKVSIIGSCTALKELPQRYLTIRKIPELCQIEKKERYFEFGPGITLSQIEEIDGTKLPKVLYEAVKTVGSQLVRNTATLGGNIFCRDFKHTLYAPLLALDTRLEIQKGNDIEHIPFSKIHDIPYGYILTRIRVPVEKWDVEIFRRIGPANILTEKSASFVFLANTDNRQLTTIKIVFAGIVAFCSTDLENKLIGSILPLPEKSIDDTINEAAVLFENECPDLPETPYLKKQFLNLLKFSLEQLG